MNLAPCINEHEEAIVVNIEGVGWVHRQTSLSLPEDFLAQRLRLLTRI
jgi:hypothetical protein